MLPEDVENKGVDRKSGVTSKRRHAFQSFHFLWN
jgi:hypothetical protein